MNNVLVTEGAVPIGGELRIVAREKRPEIHNAPVLEEAKTDQCSLYCRVITE
jgi:hypothetical protein